MAFADGGLRATQILQALNGPLVESAGIRETCPPGRARSTTKEIGIGGRVAPPPLPHHRTCGSASGGPTLPSADFCGTVRMNLFTLSHVL